MEPNNTIEVNSQSHNNKRLIILVSVLTSLSVTLVFNLLAYSLPSGAQLAEPIIQSPDPTTLSIINISPTSTLVRRDQILIVEGTGFLPGAVVNVNNTTLTTTFVSNTDLTAVMPGRSSAGILNITVTNPAPSAGTSNIVPFRVIRNLKPIISSLSSYSILVRPNNDIHIGINGLNFLNDSVVRFNGAAVNKIYGSENLLTAIIPASSLTNVGVFNIDVTNPQPVAESTSTAPVASNPVSFKVLGNNNPILSISSVSPPLVLVGSGDTQVTVSGTNFTNNARVHFNGAYITPNSVDMMGTRLIFTARRSILSRSGVFTIRVDNGQDQSNVVPFVVNNPLPGVLSVSPERITIGNNDVLLIVRGAGFLKNPDSTLAADPITPGSQSSIALSRILKFNNFDFRQTTYVVPPDNGQPYLRTTLTANEIRNLGPGKYLVTVYNPIVGGGYSNSVILTILPAPQ